MSKLPNVKRIYTQNIDGLEELAGIEKNKLIQAHGSFNTAHCPKCKLNYNIKDFKSIISFYYY